MDFWSNTLPLMEKKGVRQIDLCHLTGRSSGTVSDWINKKVPPKVDDAVKIADLLGVSVRRLVTGEDDSELSEKESELLEACKGLSMPMFDKVIKEAKDLKQMMMEEKRDYPESDMAVK